MKRDEKFIFAVVLIFITSLGIVSGASMSVNSPYTCENHNQVEICTNEYFTVNIDVDSGEQVLSAQFDLDFDSNILELISLEEGSFLGTGGQTYSIARINNKVCILYPKKINEEWIDSDAECNSYLNYAGLVWNNNLKCCMANINNGVPMMGIVRLGSGVSGSGVLSIINLKAKNVNSTDLNLNDIKILNLAQEEISVSLFNGKVDIVYWKGDANNDRTVNTKDLILLGRAFRTNKIDNPGIYDLKVDFNCDDKIDTKDLIIMGRNYRRSC